MLCVLLTSSNCSFMSMYGVPGATPQTPNIEQLKKEYVDKCHTNRNSSSPGGDFLIGALGLGISLVALASYDDGSNNEGCGDGAPSICGNGLITGPAAIFGLVSGLIYFSSGGWGNQQVKDCESLYRKPPQNVPPKEVPPDN